MTGTFSLGYGKTGLLADAEFRNNTSNNAFKSEAFFNFGYNFASIGVQYQRKKRWGIAPIGPFGGVRYLVAQARQPQLIKIDKDNDYLLKDGGDCNCTLMHLYNYGTSEAIDHQQLFHTFQFLVGNRNIIKNRFYLESAITFSPLYLLKVLDQDENIQARFQSLFLSNIRIGVGLLL